MMLFVSGQGKYPAGRGETNPAAASYIPEKPILKWKAK
jgi:hypothetical protein